MHDRPSAPELLEAVAELLAGSVAGAVPRELRFQVLVAANTCAIVARELDAGPGDAAADAELFAGLADGGGAAELAQRIRAGAFDGDLGALAEALAPHVARKVAVARPGYDADRPPS